MSTKQSAAAGLIDLVVALSPRSRVADGALSLIPHFSKAIYAIMSFGGFLGIGEKYHPLPWSTLKYDERQGGYVVNLDKEMLENAPTYGVNEGFP